MNLSEVSSLNERPTPANVRQEQALADEFTARHNPGKTGRPEETTPALWMWAAKKFKQ